MLNNRLKLCAEFVSGKGTVCDVGTDHAYLAAELTKKCPKVIATDIAKGPLDAAEKTVAELSLQGKIDLVLTDGLSGINPDGVTDAVIAGMGGETIVDILSKAEWLKNGVNLVLQAMTKESVLRKWLYSEGYAIYSENAVRDSGFVYTVINAKYFGLRLEISEYAANAGYLDYSLDISREYAETKVCQFKKAYEGLEFSGNTNESKEKKKIYETLLAVSMGRPAVTVQDIYREFDRIFPFKLQDPFDNSGFLVGDPMKSVSEIFLTLDITNAACTDDRNSLADLVISHHPVIFDPIKSVTSVSPVYHLISNGISAICAHTNLDIAKNGINDYAFELISQTVAFKHEKEVLEPIHSDGQGYGWIAELGTPICTEDLAAKLKEIFKCPNLRYSSQGKETLKRISFVSGSGGGALKSAIDKDCDCLITGDIKHNLWLDAQNAGIMLLDCGHFHTENFYLPRLQTILAANFPFLKIRIADTSTDPVSYV